MLVCASVGIGFGASVGATVSETPMAQYQSIPERNAFGLLPPPVQTAPSEAPAAVSKITLTGITTILGNKRALMKVAPVGLKPGEANKELSLILTEGQKEAEVEVLEIDEKAGSVKVNNSGTLMLLTFEKDGAKLPATPPALPLTAAGFGVVRAQGALAFTNPYALHERGLRTHAPGLPGASVPNPGAISGAVPGSVGGPTSPTGFTPSPPQTQPAAQPDLTPEEQALVIELQRQVNANNPASALLPPTALTPNEGQPTQGIPASGFAPGKSTVLVPQ